MPKSKSLRLKKPLQTGQASITAFFKTAAERKGVGQNIVTSTSTPTKRKATSPIRLERNKIYNGLHNINSEIGPIIEISDSPTPSPSLQGDNETVNISEESEVSITELSNDSELNYKKSKDSDNIIQNGSHRSTRQSQKNSIITLKTRNRQSSPSKHESNESEGNQDCQVTPVFLDKNNKQDFETTSKSPITQLPMKLPTNSCRSPTTKIDNEELKENVEITDDKNSSVNNVRISPSNLSLSQGKINSPSKSNSSPNKINISLNTINSPSETNYSPRENDNHANEGNNYYISNVNISPDKTNASSNTDQSLYKNNAITNKVNNSPCKLIMSLNKICNRNKTKQPPRKTNTFLNKLSPHKPKTSPNKMRMFANKMCTPETANVFTDMKINSLCKMGSSQNKMDISVSTNSNSISPIKIEISPNKANVSRSKVIVTPTKIKTSSKISVHEQNISIDLSPNKRNTPPDKISISPNSSSNKRSTLPNRISINLNISQNKTSSVSAYKVDVSPNNLQKCLNNITSPKQFITYPKKRNTSNNEETYPNKCSSNQLQLNSEGATQLNAVQTKKYEEKKIVCEQQKLDDKFDEKTTAQDTKKFNDMFDAKIKDEKPKDLDNMFDDEKLVEEPQDLNIIFDEKIRSEDLLELDDMCDEKIVVEEPKKLDEMFAEKIIAEKPHNLDKIFDDEILVEELHDLNNIFDEKIRGEDLQEPEDIGDGKICVERSQKLDKSIIEKIIEDAQKVDDIFEDDWNMTDVNEENDIEDLELSTFQRCEVIYFEQKSNLCSEVKLKHSSGKKATCMLDGIWSTIPLCCGDIISIQATRHSSTWRVTDCAGLVVFRPDVLLSSTTVVGAVFCRRKAVLQERFRGLDPANKAMTLGILVHELLQTSLQRRLTTVAGVQRACEHLVSSPSSVRLLYDAGMSRAEAQHEMGTFVPQVVRFINEVVVDTQSGGNKSKKADEWNGRVEKILDIEENIITPQLGLKGKIDVTLQVNIHNRKGGPSEMAPLELKTGRATVSAEHRGQLILYMMMMSLQNTSRQVSRGLLLYLKDIITLKVVTNGYPEQRDLIMLRNQLARYLAPKTKNKRTNTETESAVNADSERTNGSNPLENIELPEPINHHACSKCAYLTLCSIYQWHTNSPQISENHNLSKLRNEALGHLTEVDIEYFLHWTALLVLEDLEKTSKSPLHHIWTVPAEERERNGRCLRELQVAEVHPSGERFLHTFVRPPSRENIDSQKERNSISVGDYVLVSTESCVWIAAGSITQMDADVVCIALERDLTQRNSKDTYYHIDTYESQSQLGFNLTNLGALMDNDERSERLRRLTIRRCAAQFSSKLPREVGRLGAKLLKPLNLLQQRAVLRAVAAKDYLLIHGMPGTGKTQTVAVLIQMLVALGQKVLVTAHTHSAVDNVLQRLPEDMRVLRLGSAARVSPQLARCCEDKLTENCTTPEQLRGVYDSMDVVGVTCLGSGHTLLSKSRFDVCIVDESTQVLQSTVLRPLLAAERFVLVGDPEQLPPLVHSDLARKLGMDECLFSRLRTATAEATISLSAQYRMNSRVAALANRFTYDGQLTCASDSVRDACLDVNKQKAKDCPPAIPWLADCLNPSLEKSVLLLDTGCTVRWRGGEGKGRAANEAEVLVVMAIVKALIQAGINANDIGVITPYRDQVVLLKKCITKLQSSISPFRRRSPRKMGETQTPRAVEVNTVDQYQGRDKSVIVYSCCKTWDPENGEYTVKDLEILEDKRRLTVAVTRAKHKMIVVADVNTLRHYSTFSLLFQCLRKLDQEENSSSEISIGQPYDVLREQFGMFL